MNLLEKATTMSMIPGVREGSGVLRRQLAPWAASHHLTARQFDLAIELCLGYRNKHIADHLGIASQTVATELKLLYRKLELTTRNELVALCIMDVTAVSFPVQDTA